jgi:predicted transcriptional regulator
MDQNYQRIQESLEVFGLTKSDQEVFLFLLDARSEWSVSTIAYELELPRQTVNSILNRLAEKSIVGQVKRNNISHFYASFDQLSLYIEKQNKILKDALSTLSEEYKA